VGTPAIDSSWRDDVYLTIDSIPDKGTVWTFGVVVQPLVMWLWIGGGLVVVGSILSAIPGRRRRPTDPVSSPVIGIAAPVTPRAEAEDAIGVPAARSEAEVGPLPVGSGDPS
jgi:cytochrome c-type biogenesis protein CcmF